IAVTIPFDVRDVDSDSPEMKTLPQSFGVKKAKILSYFLLAINFGFYLFHALDFLSLILLFLTLLISSILVGYSGSNRPKYYYTILLESCSILLFASVYM
ncbi:MAG: hypothetical protein KAG37_02855, partial [Flavobacteriales bacterium]|nr:hypothetical protein [Flavobacteriales bacterium]